MSRCSRINRRTLLIPALSALISLSATAITLPPGFSDNLVTAVSAPTALAFTPDGPLLITLQGGTLRVVQGALLPAAALMFGSGVCSNWERGLLGVAVDPAFGLNHFIYLAADVELELPRPALGSRRQSQDGGSRIPQVPPGIRGR